MKEVFISYSTVDTVSAETVRNVLEKNGLSCWMAPRDIPGGSNYTKEIPIAIRNCKVFVLILSVNAQSSQWVLKELDSAVNCGKVILPFMLEDCVLNDEFNFLLTGAQRYAAYQKKAEAMETLIGRIRGILSASGSQATEAPRPQPAQKSSPIYLGDTVCSACGGSDLKPLPRRVLRHGFQEWITALLIPVLGLGVCWITTIIFSLCMPYEAFSVFPVFFIASIIGGGIWGDSLSKKIVRRNRIRRRIQSSCYRCNSCGKVFRHDEATEN